MTPKLQYGMLWGWGGREMQEDIKPVFFSSEAKFTYCSVFFLPPLFIGEASLPKDFGITWTFQKWLKLPDGFQGKILRTCSVGGLGQLKSVAKQCGTKHFVPHLWRKASTRMCVSLPSPPWAIFSASAKRAGRHSWGWRMKAGEGLALLGWAWSVV